MGAFEQEATTPSAEEVRKTHRADMHAEGELTYEGSGEKAPDAAAEESAKKIKALEEKVRVLDEEIAKAEAQMETIKAQISAGAEAAGKNPKAAQLQELLGRAYNDERKVLFDAVEKMKKEREDAAYALEFERKKTEETATA